jgi:hypothetical protein
MPNDVPEMITRREAIADPSGNAKDISRYIRGVRLLES